MNPTHDGSSASAGLSPPLTRRWSVDLGGRLSYPLIAGGKVFVTTSPDSGATIVAIDAATGRPAWGPVDLPAAQIRAQAAYDTGTVFVATWEGVVRAFDAATGALRWTQQLPATYGFASAPVAAEGTVWVEGTGSVTALDAADGRIRWNVYVPTGGSVPTLAPDGLYVPNRCDLTKLSRTTGDRLWASPGGCASGGGGEVSPLHGGRIYTRMIGTPEGYVVDAASGALLSRFDASAAPAFWQNLGFFPRGAALGAADLGGAGTLWRFDGGGDLTPPIVVDGVVYVGAASGRLSALDARSGRELWHDDVGAPLGPWYPGMPGPLAGLNAGAGLLVVPVGSTLVAYGST